MNVCFSVQWCLCVAFPLCLSLIVILCLLSQFKRAPPLYKDAQQVSTKKRDLAIFWWDRQRLSSKKLDGWWVKSYSVSDSAAALYTTIAKLLRMVNFPDSDGVGEL